jgi:ArsR family metal-binding transcriptional regulator
MSNKDFMKLLFPEVLVKKIEINEIIPCTADPERIKFLAQTDKPIGELLPVLYLSIPNAKYSERLGALSYIHQRHLITLFSTGKIGMTYVKDRSEAEELIEDARKLLNRAFIHFQTHGKPDSKLMESKKELSPMKIYEKLPKTNCKECGEESCYIFGVKLLLGEKDLSQCSHADTNELERMLNAIKI